MPGREPQLVARDVRAGDRADDLRLDAEVAERLDERARARCSWSAVSGLASSSGESAQDRGSGSWKARARRRSGAARALACTGLGRRLRRGCGVGLGSPRVLERPARRRRRGSSSGSGRPRRRPVEEVGVALGAVERRRALARAHDEVALGGLGRDGSARRVAGLARADDRGGGRGGSRASCPRRRCRWRGRRPRSTRRSASSTPARNRKTARMWLPDVADDLRGAGVQRLAERAAARLAAASAFQRSGTHRAVAEAERARGERERQRQQQADAGRRGTGAPRAARAAGRGRRRRRRGRSGRRRRCARSRAAGRRRGRRRRRPRPRPGRAGTRRRRRPRTSPRPMRSRWRCSSTGMRRRQPPERRARGRGRAGLRVGVARLARERDAGMVGRFRSFDAGDCSPAFICRSARHVAWGPHEHLT